MKCPKCGEQMKWDGLVRTSNPPMYMHKCPKCGYSEFLPTNVEESEEKQNNANLNEKALRQLLQSGFDKVKPKIEIMTNLMMDCYQQGFKDCWRILTGKEF